MLSSLSRINRWMRRFEFGFQYSQSQLIRLQGDSSMVVKWIKKRKAPDYKILSLSHDKVCLTKD